MGNEIAEDLGRMFEVGFNIGLLTYIQQHQQEILHHLDDLYLHDLRQLHFERVADGMLQRAHILADWKRQIVKQWLMFFLQRGFLTGLNFFREFHQSFEVQLNGQQLEIIYYQCNFWGSNSGNTHMRGEQEARQEILSQFACCGLDAARVRQYEHNRQGQFLNADTLLLLRYGKQWRILCVDLSAFSIKSTASLKDPNNVETLRLLLSSEISHIRSKSVFTNLSIDTGPDALDITFAEGVGRYFTAFKYEDKESAKLIQAASYAYDFYLFLTRQGILSDHDSIIWNVVGYTDQSVNTLTLRKENLTILETCATIYQHHTSKQEIFEERAKMIETIRNNAARSFINGQLLTQSINDLVREADGIHWIPPQRECIEGFTSPRDPLAYERLPESVTQRLQRLTGHTLHDVRDAHHALIQQALAENITYLFLTGNPGIGKTYAIIDFLKHHAHEGFLFFYVSPRKQVNLDVIHKFDIAATERDVLALTANADAIRRNHGTPTVLYYSRSLHGKIHKQGNKRTIEFLEAAQEQENQIRHDYRIEPLQDDLLWDKGEATSGVLDSICNALYACLTDQTQTQLVATASIQSLKKTGQGKSDTLKHLHTIFAGTMNKAGKVVPDAMRRISSRIKHLFFMVDEVTGDGSGVEFLTGIRRMIERYELTNADLGFNTKIIVADASIVDLDVIRRHLATNRYEPDKIYFRLVPSHSMVAPLDVHEFHFNTQPALAINANTYPAHRLFITYHVGMEAQLFDIGTFLTSREHLKESLQKRIIGDLVRLLQQSNNIQVIVYIQDKQRLSELIQALKKTHSPFEKNKHYIEIHANISEVEKREIALHQETARVVFMTASASRGLSFPNATHILIDIPHFEIEQNLMEIIQVIYRGRGGERDTGDKELIFYLSDRAMYYADEERILALREHTLNLLNILLILKTSIMTRIQGYGQIGLHHFMMIPIGGKSVLAAGETLTGTMERLIRELQKEFYRRPDDTRLRKVRIALKQVLSHASYVLTKKMDEANKGKTQITSYLAMRVTFSSRFANAVYDNFAQLLAWEPLEVGYIASGLLIVPATEKALQEFYLMQLDQEMRDSDQEQSLINVMYSMVKDSTYHDQLRTALRDALALISALHHTDPHKTQQFIQQNTPMDQYYALPLLMFMGNDIMRDYFLHNENEQEPEQASFRDLLALYARTLYPVHNILPIGERYGEFPFVLFRSFNLEEMRRRLFTDSYLFISHELNVLNMLLSYK